MPLPGSRHPVFTSLSTGDFQVGVSYRVRRPGGSRNWLLFVTEDGLGRIGYPGGFVAATPGSACLLEPGTPHDYACDPAPGRWVFAWAHIKVPLDWLPLLDWPAAGPGIRRLALGRGAALARVLALLREAHRHADSGMRRGRDLALLRLHEALLWCEAALPAPPAVPGPDHPLVKAVEHIARTLAQPHSVAGLARIAGLSPSRLAHAFRAAYGIPPLRYIEHQRLLRAGELLAAGGRPVAEVAALVGFSNPYHFSTRFRLWAGISPRSWRGRRQKPR